MIMLTDTDEDETMRHRYTDKHSGACAFEASGRVTYRSGRWRGSVDLGSASGVAPDAGAARAWAESLFQSRWADAARGWGLAGVRDVDVQVTVRVVLGTSR